MALDLMALRARLFLDDSQYEQGLNDAKGGLSDFAKTAKNVVSGLGIAAAVKKGVDSIISLTKSVVNAYGEYEQLAGGVETLFKNSADVVKQYAKDAYMTAGLSTNEYMETVTSFSASLLQSLGGNTKAAADLADQAIRDMSDNANKMGSDMQSIQNAYQGFAKGNYTMLDNLKLGYGGTKAEMDRLITDAMKLDKSFQANTKTVVKNKKQVKELDYNYADVVRAIHIVQTNMGITGTTAAEAADTIQGSITSTKAAWENVLTSIGRGGDMKTATSNLVKSAKNVLKNVRPVIKRAIKGLGAFITEVAPVVIKEIPKALSEGLNRIKNLLLTNGVQKISVFLNQLITGGADKAFGPAQRIIQYRLTALFENIIKAFKNAINVGRSVIEGIVDIWNTVIEPIFQDALSFILDKVLPVVNSAWELINRGLSAIPSIIGDVVNAIKDGDWWKAGSIIWDSIKSGFNAVKGWLLELVLGDDYTPESGWSDAGAKIWNAIKKGFAVVNDWLIKLLMGDDWKPESGWGDVGSRIWASIKAGFAVVNGWLLKLVLGDDYTPEAGWGTVGSKIWTAIKDGFAAVNDWLIKLVMGDEWTPEAGWGSAGAKIWQSIKDGFAVVNDWLIKLLLGEGEYTPDATWSTVGEKIWGKIVGGLSSAVDWLKNLFDGWTEKLTDGSIDFASIGTTIGSTVWGAIKDAFNTVVSWFKYLFGGESDDDQNSVKGAIYSIDWAGLGTSIFGFIGAAFDGIVATYTGYFQSAWDAIKEMDWAGLGDAMWNAITGAFDTIASWFKETFRGPINTVIDYINEMITNFENAFNRVIDGINYLLGTNFERKVFDRVQKIYDTVFGTTPVYGGGGGAVPGSGAGRRDIRGYAGGGILRNGDVGIVGEYQPEFLQMINGKAVVTPLNTGRFPGGGGQEVVVPRNESRQLTVILELDRQQMGKMVYRLNNEETQRVGVKLAKGVAY